MKGGWHLEKDAVASLIFLAPVLANDARPAVQVAKCWSVHKFCKKRMLDRGDMMSLNKNYVRSSILFAACLSLLLPVPLAKAQATVPYLQWSSGGFEVWSPNGQESGAPSMLTTSSYSEYVSVSGLPAGANATVSCYDTAQGEILSWSTTSDGGAGGYWSPTHQGPNNVYCTLSYTSPSGNGAVETGMVSIQVY